MPCQNRGRSDGVNRQAAHCAPGRTMQWLLVQRGSWLEKLRLSRGRMTRLNTVRYALRTTFENARFLSCALAPDSRPPPPVTHRLGLDHRELLQQGCCTAMRIATIDGKMLRYACDISTSPQGVRHG